MAIHLECAQGHKIRVKDELLGKKIRCPNCQSVVRVESPDSDDADDDSWDAPDSRRLPTRTVNGASNRSRSESTRSKLPLAIAAAVVVVVVAVAFVFLRRPASGSNASSEVADTVVPSSEPSKPAIEPAAASSQKTSPKSVNNSTAAASVKTTAVPSSTPAKEPATPGKADQNKKNVPAPAPENKPPAAEAKLTGLAGWDTEDSGGQGDSPGSPTWNRISLAADGTYRFRGNAVIENAFLQLRVPRDGTELSLVSKEGAGQSAMLPITISGRGSKAKGPRAIRITQLSDDSITIEAGPDRAGSGANVALRLPRDKYWIEIKPLANAERVSVGLKSQLVVVPSEFTEDLICDSATLEIGKNIPLPKENALLALNCNGNFMSMMTFPSKEQAGELIVSAGEGVTNHGVAVNTIVSAATAHFREKSVFIGLLPQKDNWYYEAGGKKYSAAGQYPIPWKPPYAGIWRLGGRVKGKCFVNDVSDEHFTFACSQSGTLDFLFAYLHHTTDDAAAGVATPLAILRETLDTSPGSSPRPEVDPALEAAVLALRKTKYKDVCNSVDDMKEVWRNDPERLKSEPDYVKSLLLDSKSIIDRMDQRLNEYDALAHDIEALISRLKEEGGADAKSFLADAQKVQTKLKLGKAPDAKKADEYIAGIEKKLELNPTSKKQFAELDKLAESMRDIASFQEVLLKKQRNVTLELAEACTKKEAAASEKVRPLLVAIGRECRSVLRNRDSEE